MSLALVAAKSDNNCIGADNKLPWHIPEDFVRYKQLTMGKVLIMGRKTWESLPEKFRPLPGRTNVVITRQKNYAVPAGVEVYERVEDALATHVGDEIISNGGAEIYRQTIDLADTLYITEVHTTVDGDAFFPPIDPLVWKEVQREDHEDFSFVTYKKG